METEAESGPTKEGADSTAGDARPKEGPRQAEIRARGTHEGAGQEAQGHVGGGTRNLLQRTDGDGGCVPMVSYPHCSKEYHTLNLVPNRQKKKVQYGEYSRTVTMFK